MSDATLLPSAYAPYRSPRDYILNWTDVIWIDRAIGRLADHYGQDVRVHTAYGETYDFDTVISNSVQKFAAFPNTGGGLGEDVVWEQRGANGFISSHRTLKSGTHTGYWTYGAPTGRDFVSRTIAHCLVQDNKIVEEWLVRDEWAVLEGLGLDPRRIAEQLARESPVTGEAPTLAAEVGPFAGHYADPARIGISGPRPTRHVTECALIAELFEVGLERAALRPRHGIRQRAHRPADGAEPPCAERHPVPDRDDQPARELSRCPGRAA